MIDQKRAINRNDWDYLLILDACRYDYFEREYKKYLLGKLRIAKSPVNPVNGIATAEWCKAVFTRRYDDIIYISATPIVNSKMKVKGFEASKHFYKIIDVWEYAWNDEFGTVLPEDVNKAILEVREEYPDKRIIAHYVQPHFPYLTLKGKYKPRKEHPTITNSLKRNLRNFIGSKVRLMLGDEITIKLMHLLRLPPPNPMHEVLRNLGRDVLINAYINNLRIVLETVSEVIKELEGKIIVTSDHGEYLGENGFYGHSYLPKHPVLNYVPWLEINQV